MGKNTLGAEPPQTDHVWFVAISDGRTHCEVPWFRGWSVVEQADRPTRSGLESLELIENDCCISFHAPSFAHEGSDTTCSCDWSVWQTPATRSLQSSYDAYSS